MSDPDPLGDALLALRALAVDPIRIGGVWLRGGAGPLRDRLLQQLRTWSPEGIAVRALPSSVDDARLDGGIDVAASLAAGRAVHREGVLAECRSGVLIVHSAERLRIGVAARLGQARDQGGPALLLLDDGLSDERPPACLIDRIGPVIDIGCCRDLPKLDERTPDTAMLPIGDLQRRALASVASRLGVDSPRALLFASNIAEILTESRESVDDAAVIAAARLVLAPRATRMPGDMEAAPPPPAPEAEDQQTATMLEDLVLDAVRPHLMPDLIAALAEGRSRSRGIHSAGHGARMRSGSHGRPIGSRSGMPSAGIRLALIDTLRAAAPWQAARGRGQGRVQLRRDDLKVRRFEDRQTVLSIFVVDASGSAAFSRLAEAKGAVELLLERAYARRAEVALIAFRGTTAELLLPPTRSLTRARRLLGDLPGGGGTPLAAGLDEARLLADSMRAKGRTAQLIVLTDGRANVARGGGQDRANAVSDAEAAARQIAVSGHGAVVIDISARKNGEAARLASAMRARLVHLPHAEAGALAAAAA